MKERVKDEEEHPMGYIVNVDRPLGRATINTDDLGNQINCHPHGKLPENASWTEPLGSEDALLDA